jgi:SAM-dependent methyltransferase
MKANWTGERLETFMHDESTLEHLHRYAIAIDLVKERTVLDLACGEGYGSNLLAMHAKQVTGADINKDTIKAAERKYRKANLQFMAAAVEELPFPDKHFDVVVSFETLEHTSNHEKMLDEIKRVLADGGKLIISTPDKKNYSEIPGYANPFHVKELYREEFTAMIRSRFQHSSFIDQRLMIASVGLAGQPNELILYEGDYQSVRRKTHIDPYYIIAVASDSPLPALHSSVFTSRAVLETALSEREKVLKNTLTYKLGHLLLYPFKYLGKKLDRKSSNPHG